MCSTHTPDYPTRVHARPVDYFMGDTESKDSNGTRLLIIGTSVTTLIFTSVMFNLYNNRPRLSGMPRHIGLAVVGLLAGNWFHVHRLNYLAEQDAAIRHYIELHPDDFPPFERKKYKDVLLPWTPRR